MTGKRRFERSIGKIDKTKLNNPSEFPGILGVGIGGEKRIEVPDREGYVYVRIRDDLSELVKAYNDQVSPVYGLPVIIVRDPIDVSRYRVKGRDLGRYQNWGSSAYVPKHAAQHSFDPKSPGADPVWVWGRQYMPLAATPSGSAGGPNVIIQGPAIYYQNKDWLCGGGTGTADIAPANNPTGAWARMVLVYLDQFTNPQLLAGDTFFDVSLTGSCQVTPYIPDLPDTSNIPIAGVRLLSGTSTISWNNIYDLRPHIVGDGFIPTGTSGHIIQEDGVSLTNRERLNFTGGLVAYDDPINETTIVSGTANLSTEAGADDNYIAVYKDANTIEGKSNLQWDETTFTIGDGTAGRDYILKFDGENRDGSITWKEDEWRWEFSDHILMDAARRIYFRDLAINIFSNSDGVLSIAADGYLNLVVPYAVLGNGLAGVDPYLQFNGETNDGVLTWMEDEDRFDFADTVKTDQGRIVNTTRVTTTYTALVTDHVIFCDTDGGAFTLTLPVGAEGQFFRIINVGSSGNVLTIDGNGAETVMGSATQNVSDGEIMILVYNSVEGWW